MFRLGATSGRIASQSSKRFYSTSSTSSSTPRSTPYATYAAGTTLALALTYGATSYLHSESPKTIPGDTRPHPLWSPPTRSQMIQALKASSASSLRPKSSRSTADDTSLTTTAKDASSSAPSPAAASHAASVGAGLGRPHSENDEGFDLLIVGGGATGAGCAVDAATRGLSVALVERDDFSAGTSSKSTKLIHGGVRYLQKAVFELDYGQYKMVREALHERKTFLHIAPYLSEHLPIMLPVYR